MGETIGVNMKHDLGAVICRECDEVITTLPTEGVKKVFSICPHCFEHNTNNKQHKQ